jgi:hypothetical protein|tara:strand:+ start:1715 stop:1897 length:183 start_codon:yes stop_codon:yes gene_type:complete
MEETKKRLNVISERLSEINEFFNIYNISDEDSIISVREEVGNYKKELKKISDEKLKRGNK